VEFTVAAMEQDGRISGAVDVFRDITERKRLEERITHMALFDELTGLPNRSFLFDALQRMAAAALRRQELVGLLYVDLDGFKGINDAMGHAAGDAVLREVAARLKACVRTEDVAARLGGDEFLVVTLTGRAGAEENCVALARRIIDAMRAPIPVPEGAAQTGASVGIALFPDSHDVIERCIQMADAAMYQAKKAGRGGYAVAEGGRKAGEPIAPV
jgi:diguanylate cyclase (GGDEF)-like protein